MTKCLVNNTFHCHCKNSSYCDPLDKHIVTGDRKFIQFISNYKLRKLKAIVERSYYRENRMINYKKRKECIEKVLLLTIESLSSKYILTKDTLAAWDDKIISMIEERISHLMQKQPPEVFYENRCS